MKPSKYDRPLVPEKKPVAAAAAPAKKAPAKKAPPKKEAAPKDEPMEDPYANPTPAEEDRPIKAGNTTAADPYDEIPIGGNKPSSNVMDEQPIGGKGGYNLDNLNEFDAFGGGGGDGGFGNPPPIKKKPPARLAAAKKAPVEEETPALPKPDVEMADETVMSPKKAEVKKAPPKPPAESKPKPATTSAKPAAGGAKAAAASIQEEDVG